MEKGPGAQQWRFCLPRERFKENKSTGLLVYFGQKRSKRRIHVHHIPIMDMQPVCNQVSTI
jgi:hypothetical protein